MKVVEVNEFYLILSYFVFSFEISECTLGFISSEFENKYKPRSEDTPDRCRLKTARSTEPPLCDCTPVRGMYIVQPEPIPCSTKTLARSRTMAGGRSQKLILFSRGNAISGAPTSTGAK